MIPATLTGTPCRSAVEEQLERILASRFFAKARQRSRILSFIVKASLDSRPLSELDILMEFFESRKALNGSTIVRTTCSDIRTLLNNYYRTLGKEDSVVITAPPKEKYRAVFEYNTDGSAWKECEERWGKMVAEYPAGYSWSLHWVDRLTEKYPDFAPAFVLRAKLDLWYAIANIAERSPHELLSSAMTAIRRALDLSPNAWDAHMVLGTISVCQLNWEQAAGAFDLASKLDYEQTQNSHWYAAFLLANGRNAEGLDIARRRSRARPHDLFEETIYGLFLYAAGELDEAEYVFAHLMKLEIWSTWLAHVGFACVCIAKARYAKAFDTLKGIYCYLSDKSDSDFVFYPGLMSLVLFRLGDAEAAERFSRVYIDSLGLDHEFQRVLDALGFENVAVMERLVAFGSRHDPLMAWFHVLPIFDSLRESEAHKILLSRLQPHTL